jgi:hypothetical protein
VSAEIASFLRGTMALDLMLLVALYLTLTRKPVSADLPARRGLVGLGALAVATQAAHFAEEWATTFYERFPVLLGLEPWSAALWVWFNFSWIGIWGFALLAIGLRLRWRGALFPVWFLAVGCAVNGVAHPLLAVAAGGYFPGLWTSPVAGLVGVLLLGRLGRFTRPSALSLRAA